MADYFCNIVGKPTISDNEGAVRCRGVCYSEVELTTLVTGCPIDAMARSQEDHDLRAVLIRFRASKEGKGLLRLRLASVNFVLEK